MKTFVVVKNLRYTDGISYWLTDDVANEDTGISGAGFGDVESAVEDAIFSIDRLDDVYIADLTSYGDAVLEYFGASLLELVNQNLLAFSEWKSLKDA